MRVLCSMQCFAAEARDALLGVREKKTPLDMLLVFKACIDRINDAITQNVKLRRLDFGAYTSLGYHQYRLTCVDH